MIVFGLGAELDSKRTNLFRQVEWFAFTGYKLQALFLGDDA